MTDAPIILWFRRDLRLTENPALHAAIESGKPIIPLYIFETEMNRKLGAASLWWLHHSLTSLAKSLEDIGLHLVRRKGKASEIIDDVISETSADHIVWGRRYGEGARERDKAIKSDMSERGVKVESFKSNLLTEPWEVETKTGGYYKVFTPYWRNAKTQIDNHKPIAAPKSAKAHKMIKSDDLSDWDLLPTRPNWAKKIKPHWQPGEEGAAKALKVFLDEPVETYAKDRNRPDRAGTSQLSPHLAFGEISPRQIWHATKDNDYTSDKFLAEIGWREFSYVLLYYNPKLASENFKSAFDSFEWDTDEQALERWQQGNTGYPFVDAGMRQLWQTGWQHNRVRMVTASFLIKHLLLDWRDGEAWFWDTLVDADPASNAAGWQWVAGSGADASPYFRIFNPFTQGEKFDPNGDYVRKYIPELADLPNKYIHRPWEAPKDVLKKAGVTLGKTYPEPIVDHKEARERALSAYKASRGE